MTRENKIYGAYDLRHRAMEWLRQYYLRNGWTEDAAKIQVTVVEAGGNLYETVFAYREEESECKNPVSNTDQSLEDLQAEIIKAIQVYAVRSVERLIPVPTVRDFSIYLVAAHSLQIHKIVTCAQQAIDRLNWMSDFTEEGENETE